MSRLVVASNRVADIEKAAQSGGLAVALGDALADANGVWFGWDGTISNDETPQRITRVRQGPVETVTVPLSRREYEEYYLGFSNKTLWPTFHYRLDLAELEAAFLDGYRRVNRRFAQVLVDFLEPDDLVWIHDYHLIPLAAELRSLGASQRMGFFLHIPFPPPDILLAVPDHEWLVRSMFSYDVVGFQTAADVTNFTRYVLDHSDGATVEGNRLRAFGRTIVAGKCPIGIDVDAFYEMAHTAEADEHIERLERRTMARNHIIGVERLDYTKGLPDRFRAFGRLLELYPENRKAVTLMQIAPPSREEVEAYTELREELEGLSGAINGEFGDFDWTPVRYIHRSLPRKTLAALFRGSQVGFVTPLRDGMNLVAKEYVAAQDADDPGVLVLSRFAGAAEDLDAAVLVNPYDVDEMANALQRAITMRLGERRERYESLIARVREHDVTNWQTSFLDILKATREEAA